jgi:hypothetical protein
MDSNFLSLINMLYLKRSEGFKVFLELKDNQIISLYILDYFKYENPRPFSELVLICRLLELIFAIVLNDIIKRYKNVPLSMQLTIHEFNEEFYNIHKELFDNNPQYPKNSPLNQFELKLKNYYNIIHFNEQMSFLLFPLLFTKTDITTEQKSTGHIYINFLDHLFLNPLSRLKQQFYILLDDKFILFSRHDEERLNSYCFNKGDPFCDIIYTEKLNSILRLKDKKLNTPILMNYYPKEFLDYYKNICIIIEKAIENPKILDLPYFLEITKQKELNLNFNKDETELNNFKNFWKEYCNKFLFPLYKDKIFKK